MVIEKINGVKKIKYHYRIAKINFSIIAFWNFYVFEEVFNIFGDWIPNFCKMIVSWDIS